MSALTRTCRVCDTPLPGRLDRTCSACQRANADRHRALRRGAQIPATVREEVIARDGHACRYCGCAVVIGSGGRYPNRDRLELDHVVPAARGGLGVAANLVVSCLWCNRKKNTREVTV